MDIYFVLDISPIMALLTYNLFRYREKKTLLSGVSYSIIHRFESKPQKGVSRILSSVGFWTVIEIIVFSAVQYLPVMYLNTAFGELMNTGANYFGLIFFAPLLVVAFCFLVKVNPLAQLDLITPAYPLALIFVKIICFTDGCCRGVRWIYGFYNPTSRLIEFPVQLLESAAALLLFVFLLLCRKKFKKGTAFPIYLISYSAIRFFTEFLRVEPAVFMGLKTYQILCIVGVVVGILEYFIACKYNSRLQRNKEQSQSYLKLEA